MFELVVVENAPEFTTGNKLADSSVSNIVTMELEHLQRTVDVLTTTLEGAQTFVKTAYSSIDSGLTNITDAIAKAEVEISQLEAEIDNRIHDILRKAKQDEAENWDEPADATPLTSYNKTKTQKEKIKKAKEIFRRIASACHPDKTKDKRLIEIFINAKKAYVDHNVSELVRLEASIKKKSPSALMMDMLHKLQSLQERELLLRNSLYQIRNSRDMYIARLSKSFPSDATELRKADLTEQLASRMEAISRMTSRLREQNEWE